jgi:hypothetical protein
MHEVDIHQRHADDHLPMHLSRVVKCTYSRTRTCDHGIWSSHLAARLSLMSGSRVAAFYQVEVRRPKKRRISHHLHMLVHVWTGAGTSAMLCVRCPGSSDATCYILCVTSFQVARCSH